jgi:hypothetical protein
MPTNNPLTDIYENLKQQALENSLKEIKQELKLLRESEGNSKLIELEMYQSGSDNPQKKMVSINTRYIVFVEDSEPCTIVHMSNGALLKVVESCDDIMKLVEGDRGKSYIK